MYGRMSGWYGLWVLIFALLTKCRSGTVGRSSDVENNRKGFYENNPYFNASFPSELYRHTHYSDHHHHHGHYYHNHDEGTGSNYRFPEQYSSNNFPDTTHHDNFPDGPKTTTRRQVAEEVDPNYPYAEIRNFFDRNPLFKQYFAKIPKLGNRDGAPDDDDGESLCKMQVIRTFHPKSLKNINNVERLIVNDDEEYKQAIEETKCVNSECDIPFDAFGYTSFCHQKIDSKRLMVYDNVTKNIVFDEFKVPSCCICKIRRK